jgi:hypothetical protein
VIKRTHARDAVRQKGQVELAGVELRQVVTLWNRFRTRFAVQSRCERSADRVHASAGAELSLNHGRLMTLILQLIRSAESRQPAAQYQDTLRRPFAIEPVRLRERGRRDQ